MKLNSRLLIFLATFILGVALSLPSLISSMSGPRITLGLDLQGGLHMLLGVKTEEAVKARLKSLAASVKYYTAKNDILTESITVSDGAGVQFSLIDKDDGKKLRAELLDKMEGINIIQEENRFRLTVKPDEAIKIKEFAVTQAIEVIRNRLDLFGLSEPIVAKNGDDKILVQLPGIKNAAEEQRARELIAKAAKLEMMAVDEAKAANVATMSPEEAASYGDIILPDYKTEGERHLLKEIPILDGGMIANAQVGFDQNNQPIINFTLTSEGGNIFGDYTAKNTGTRMAIVLDGKVYSAPVIRERIGGGSGQISGRFTPDEARDVAIALRSGALQAPVVMLEKRSVGPSLGADSIKASLIALFAGAFVVFAFMAIYYGLSGWIANIALISNVVLIIAVMALFGATLTLPGMAGIVLTLGMSVDANVLINERIREVLRQGGTIRKSIEDGYSNAFSTIVDANVTALITCVALYAFGTGPIKGFALTISIGILVSMLTAIVGTHGMFDKLLPLIEKSKNTRRWFGLSLTKDRHGTL